MRKIKNRIFPDREALRNIEMFRDIINSFSSSFLSSLFIFRFALFDLSILDDHVMRS